MKALLYLACNCAFTLFNSAVFAQTIAPPAPAPQIAAQAYLLTDLTSGQTLIGQNADERREPASLTKLMAAYVIFSALKQKQIQWTQLVKISERAWKTEGSRMFIEPNKSVTVEELLRGMIVISGNDATLALAETVAGSEEAFVQRMNSEAQRLGLKNTHFINSTGLSHAQHYSTAADLTRLAAAIINDFADYYPLYSIKEHRFNNITQYNRNRLLWSDQHVDGMKTGFTEAAGYCLIASARRGQRRLLAVVLGTGSDALRAQESQKLLNFGFQFYDTARLYEKNQTISTLNVWKGAGKTLKAGFVDDVFLTIPKGKIEKLKVTMETAQPLIAPITQGQRVGTVKVAFDGKSLADYPLLALENVPQANLFGRAWDSVRLWWQ